MYSICFKNTKNCRVRSHPRLSINDPDRQRLRHAGTTRTTSHKGETILCPLCRLCKGIPCRANNAEVELYTKELVTSLFRPHSYCHIHLLADSRGKE